MITRLWHALFKNHEYRRARKSQDAAYTYCACGEKRAVRKRKAKEA